jgi:hypothetical protein
MRTCDQSGIFASIRYCQALGPNGSTFPISMTIAQGGNDRTQLTGTLNLGTLAGAFTGNVTGDARMIIGTNLTVTTSGVTFTYRVGGWESRISGTSSMTGQWADNLAAIGTVGNAYTENTIQTFTRTSVADVPITPAQLHYVFPTVQDFVSVLRGR